jgi:phosphatidylserine decarboxylase
VYAAADGLVTTVEESVPDPWLPDGHAVRITTFLNLQNVHVNRSPVAGRLTEETSIGGGYAPALFPGAADNARRRIAIDGPAGRVVVVQVSGLLVRKISSWVAKGETVAAGQRIGMIHFGSRTDVLLPIGSAVVLVRPGQRVLAGVTPLARYHFAETGNTGEGEPHS